jgi:hypothetical protein
MSINDLFPELYLRELTGDYSLFASVLRAYLATNPNDTAWAEETLGQLMSSSSLPGAIHYVGTLYRFFLDSKRWICLLNKNLLELMNC